MTHGGVWEEQKSVVDTQDLRSLRVSIRDVLANYAFELNEQWNFSFVYHTSSTFSHNHHNENSFDCSTTYIQKICIHGTRHGLAHA